MEGTELKLREVNDGGMGGHMPKEVQGETRLISLTPITRELEVQAMKLLEVIQAEMLALVAIQAQRMGVAVPAVPPLRSVI